MVLNEQIDFFSELFGTPKSSPANRLSGDFAEPRVDLVQPRGIGWGELGMVPVNYGTS